jgi:hypothetical protein
LHPCCTLSTHTLSLAQTHFDTRPSASAPPCVSSLCLCYVRIQAGVSAPRLYKPTNRRCSLLVHSPLPFFFLSKATGVFLVLGEKVPVGEAGQVQRHAGARPRRSIDLARGTPAAVWGAEIVGRSEESSCCFSASSCTCSPSPPWPSHHLPPRAIVAIHGLSLSDAADASVVSSLGDRRLNLDAAAAATSKQGRYELCHFNVAGRGVNLHPRTIFCFYYLFIFHCSLYNALTPILVWFLTKDSNY